MDEPSAAAAPFKSAELLKRLGTSRESLARLSRKAAQAERLIGIHGVSVTAGMASGPASTALRNVVEWHFEVHETPSRADPLHRTLSQLPKRLQIDSTHYLVGVDHT